MKKDRTIIVLPTDTPLAPDEALLLILQAMESIVSTEADVG